MPLLFLSLTDTEWCVIAAIVAAAIIALSVRPAAAGPVTQQFLRGQLSRQGYDEPSLDIDCRPDGSVVIWRNGLENLTSADELNLTCNTRGLDIELIERRPPSATSFSDATPVDSARFVIPSLGREHYHLIYRLHDSIAASFTLHNAPGVSRHILLQI